MPTLNSETKAARIRREDLDVLEPFLEKEGISFSEWVHRQIGDMTLPKYKLPTDIIPDFNDILNLYGLDVGGFVKVMYEKIANFDLDVEELIK